MPLFARFLPILVEDLIHGFRREVLVKVVVDLDGGCPAAGTNAFDLFEREDTVGGDSLVADAETLAAMLEELVASAQHAADVGADLDVEFSGWLGTQQGVVAEHAEHVVFLDADAGGDLGHHCRGDVADLILRVEQHGNEGGAAQRIERDQLVEAGRKLGGKDGGLGGQRLLLVKNLCCKCFSSYFELQFAPAIAQRYQAVFVDFAFAALEHSLGPGVIFICSPASSTGCRIVQQSQNFTFTAKGETSLFASVNQGMLRDGLAQIVRRYIRADESCERNPQLRVYPTRQCFCRHFSPLSLRPLHSFWQLRSFRAPKFS